MLIKTCYKDNAKSLYKCDRCGKNCEINDCKGIFITDKFRSPIKKWDLCLRCYEALERGVEHRK